jgi:hypothetical protein
MQQIRGAYHILAGKILLRPKGCKEKARYTIDIPPYHLTVAIYDTAGPHAYNHHALMYRFKMYRGAVDERYGTVYLPARWQHIHPVLVEDAAK